MKLLKVLPAMLFAALPAAAQAKVAASTGAGLPSSVLWMAAIAGFLGFLIGSVPPRGENRGWSFDGMGAVSWAIAGASMAGGLTYWGATGAMLPALYFVLAAFAVAGFRVYSTRAPRVPHGEDLEDGVHYGAGDSQSARFKAARAIYKHASFKSGSGYFATRSPIEWNFNASGASASALSALAEGAASANREQFDILVLLVHDVDGKGPAVVVVRGAQKLRGMKVQNRSIIVPGSVDIDTTQIASMVGYAWR